jgi:Fe-Mn family superoxide dismutase
MTRFTLKALPYPADALSPVMSARTVQIHHGKHQAAYASKLESLTENSEHRHYDLDHLIIRTYNSRRERAIFNNASQLRNHEFFWESLTPNTVVDPPRPIAERLVQSFGSLQEFREEFVRKAVNQFGSGWAWLVISPSGAWRIDTTHDADNPVLWGGFPLFVCDLWEHAYYLDWQQDRAGFVRAVVERLINWERVSLRLSQFQSRHAA